MIGPQIQDFDLLKIFTETRDVIDSCILSKKYGIENVLIPINILPHDWKRVIGIIRQECISVGWNYVGVTEGQSLLISIHFGE